MGAGAVGALERRRVRQVVGREREPDELRVVEALLAAASRASRDSPLELDPPHAARPRQAQPASASRRVPQISPAHGSLSCHAVAAPCCPEMAAMGCAAGVPEPSRRPGSAGRSTGAPLAAPATAGAGPTYATSSVSSPRRNRWQRTPPVPRPLPGYSPNGVTLTLPASVPGSALPAPATVTTTLSALGVDGRRRRPTYAPAASRTPATPPPDRPCGRTTDAGKCSSWASLVTKTSSLVAGRLDPADDGVAVVEPDQVPAVLGEHLGLDPLDDAVRVPSASPGESGQQGGERHDPLARRRARRTR